MIDLYHLYTLKKFNLTLTWRWYLVQIQVQLTWFATKIETHGGSPTMLKLEVTILEIGWTYYRRKLFGHLLHDQIGCHFSWNRFNRLSVMIGNFNCTTINIWITQIVIPADHIKQYFFSSEFQLDNSFFIITTRHQLVFNVGED